MKIAISESGRKGTERDRDKRGETDESTIDVTVGCEASSVPVTSVEALTLKKINEKEKKEKDSCPLEKRRQHTRPLGGPSPVCGYLRRVASAAKGAALRPQQHRMALRSALGELRRDRRGVRRNLMKVAPTGHDRHEIIDGKHVHCSEMRSAGIGEVVKGRRRADADSTGGLENDIHHLIDRFAIVRNRGHRFVSVLCPPLRMPQDPVCNLRESYSRIFDIASSTK
jgi:hypothetical protein